MNHDRLLQAMASIILVVLFLVGCAAPVATPTPVITNTALPTPTSVPPTSLPTLVPPTSTSTPMTASTDTAIVTGKLIYGDTGQSLEQGKLVRLVQVDEAEGETVLIFGGEKDPMAETQTDGTFVISDVPPGKYAMVVHAVKGALFVQLVSPSGTPILIAFDKGGQKIDLGVIQVVAP